MSKPIADPLPKGCPISLILQEGTVELHRRVLLNDLLEPSAFRDLFITQYNIASSDHAIRKQVETLSIPQIKAFSGY
tara:strand:+ start:522 stop:752 length:231 start_codon:yes stop_codon:yes gene_type:complete